MHRMLSKRSGDLRSKDVAIPKVVKSAKSSNLAPEKGKGKRKKEFANICSTENPSETGRISTWINPVCESNMAARIGHVFCRPWRRRSVFSAEEDGGDSGRGSHDRGGIPARRVNNPSNFRYAQEPKQRDQTDNRSMILWN